MSLSYPCVSDRMSLVRKHPVHLRWTTVFSSRLSNHLSATGVRTSLGLTFHLSQEQISFTHNQNILLIWHAEETFHGQAGRCACVLRYRALSRALCELKEAADHSLETQTECAVHRTFSPAASSTNVQCSLCVRARLCTRANAPLESKCLMG